MEVVASAYKHGVAAADIPHAWDNAIRLVEYDYDGTGCWSLGLIGTARCWSWWRCRRERRCGSSTPIGCGPAVTTEVMTMTDLATGELAALEAVTPATHASRDATYFRVIITARKGVDDAEAALRAAVAQARAAGDSWTVIGAALGTTRQAAFQRFGNAKSGAVNTPAAPSR